MSVHKPYFRLEINDKNVESAIGFVKVIISLSTAIIAAFVLKGNPGDLNGHTVAAVFLSFMAILTGLQTYMYLGAFLGGFNEGKLKGPTRYYFYGCIYSFGTALMLLMSSFVLTALLDTETTKPNKAVEANRKPTVGSVPAVENEPKTDIDTSSSAPDGSP